MNILFDLALLIFCYIAGAVPSGLIIARKAAGIDIREHGSKNIGMTNVWRVLGAKWGLVTLLADAGKACIAVLIVKAFATAAIPAMPELGGVAVLLGNFFNCFLGFKGGKGVAASLGVFLALAPVAILIVFVTFVVIVAVTRYISLGSITGATIFPIIVYIQNGLTPLFFMVLVISALIIFKHRANIGRLLKGTENKFAFKK